jgi:hypothetical protein
LVSGLAVEDPPLETVLFEHEDIVAAMRSLPEE